MHRLLLIFTKIVLSCISAIVNQTVFLFAFMRTTLNARYLGTSWLRGCGKSEPLERNGWGWLKRPVPLRPSIKCIK
jgi:hypothetical protein